MTRVVIVGAGGHAQVVADILLCLRAAGREIIPVGYLDDDSRLHGRTLLQLPVLGGVSAIRRVPHDATIVAIGNNRTRYRLAESLQLAGESFVSARHPTAVVAADVSIGLGVVLCAGVIINTGSVIGSHSILNTGCTVDHHSRIGSAVHIAPGAHTGG